MDLKADFLFVCKPSSHKRIYELLHDDFIHSSGWIKTRNREQQVERQRFRWMNGPPVRDSDDAVIGAWVEFATERNGERTYTNTFFTSLEVTADNVAAIARVGRAKWWIERCVTAHLSIHHRSPWDVISRCLWRAPRLPRGDRLRCRGPDPTGMDSPARLLGTGHHRSTKPHVCGGVRRSPLER